MKYTPVISLGGSALNSARLFVFFSQPNNAFIGYVAASLGVNQRL